MRADCSTVMPCPVEMTRGSVETGYRRRTDGVQTFASNGLCQTWLSSAKVRPSLLRSHALVQTPSEARLDPGDRSEAGGPWLGPGGRGGGRIRHKDGERASEHW